jgi:Carboxypeptidase regulatory-like domain/Polysaccharide lyase family 4, domain II
MRFLTWPVCLPLLAGILSFAPSAAATTPAKAILEGSVLKSQTGEPVKKALIEVVSDDSVDPKVFTATSNGEGQFILDGIPAGEYRVFAERTGFIEVDKKGHQAGQTAISLQAGQHLQDVTLYMLPAAIVTGRVFDEDGDPMAEVDMVAWRPTYSPGGIRWENAATQRTNDLGEYRMSGLFPGKYLVSATPGPGIENVSTQLKDPSAPPGPDLAYFTTYYPNVAERLQATPLEIHPADDLSLDFSLTRVPASTIHGTVANLDRGSKAVVSMHMSEDEQFLTQIDVDKNGKFEIKHVPPGTYTILALVNSGDMVQVAHQVVNVTGTNVEGVRLIPSPGATVQGQVRFDEGRAVNPEGLSIDLHATNGDDEPLGITRFVGDNNHVAADGRFAWKNVPAGTYYVTVNIGSAPGSDYFIKSLMSGGQNLLDSGLVVNGSSLIIDVVLSTKAVSVEGHAVNTKNEPVPNAMVVAVPDSSLRKRPDRYVQATADQTGHFRLHGMAPGNYTVFAFSDLDGNQFYDPEFLKAHESAGKALHTDEGAHENLTLTAVPSTDDAAQTAER